MKFFEAIDEKRRLQNQGFDAVHLECRKNYEGREIYSVVFKSRKEADDFRISKKDWDVEINEII